MIVRSWRFDPLYSAGAGVTFGRLALCPPAMTVTAGDASGDGLEITTADVGTGVAVAACSGMGVASGVGVLVGRGAGVASGSARYQSDAFQRRGVQALGQTPPTSERAAGKACSQ